MLQHPMTQYSNIELVTGNSDMSYKSDSSEKCTAKQTILPE